jgi:hypothetical protein
MTDSLIYKKTELTGGGVNALDAIDGNALFGGEMAFVHTATKQLYIYQLNATSAQEESSPDIISPDDNAGDKRWELLTPQTGIIE